MNISVIIPIYNVERFVERCITSIMNQTCTKGVECIIVNDCTPDRSMEIVEELVTRYDGFIKFKLLYHEYNRGLAAVRNTGLNAATGDYIIHIDSDDYCGADMLEKMYTKAIEEDADMVIADFWRTYETDEIYSSQKVPNTVIDRIKNLLTGTLSWVVWNRMCRRSLFVDNHIESVEGIDFGEDFLLNVYLHFYATKVVHVPHAFVHYVQCNTSSYTNAMSLKSLQSILKREKAIMSFFDNLEFKKELYPYLLEMRMFNRFTLLLHSKGALQKEWNALYCDIPLILAFRCLLTSKLVSLYWRIPLFFASVRMLLPFNLMRKLWRTMRPALSNKVKVYE